MEALAKHNSYQPCMLDIVKENEGSFRSSSSKQRSVVRTLRGDILYAIITINLLSVASSAFEQGANLN